jgi:antitoxin component HigA of HigAB toxin-antitoxin module
MPNIRKIKDEDELNEALTEISYQIDDYLVELSTKNGLDIVETSSLILARLTVLNSHLGTSEFFEKLLTFTKQNLKSVVPPKSSVH